MAQRHVLGLVFCLFSLACSGLAERSNERANPAFSLVAEVDVTASNFVEASKTCEQVCVAEARGAAWRAQVVAWEGEQAWSCECQTAQVPAHPLAVIQANAAADPMQPGGGTAVLAHR